MTLSLHLSAFHPSLFSSYLYHLFIADLLLFLLVLNLFSLLFVFVCILWVWWQQWLGVCMGWVRSG